MEHQLNNQVNPPTGSLSSNPLHIIAEVTGSSPVPPTILVLARYTTRGAFNG